MSADEIAILMNEMHKIRGDISFVEMRQIVDLFQSAGFVKQNVVIANSATTTEKQIEKMAMTPLDVLANDINQHCPSLQEIYCDDTKHCVACLANALYNAGYRKQSEGEWEMFDLITSTYYGKRYYFLNEDGSVYSRASHSNMSRDEAIDEFLSIFRE